MGNLHSQPLDSTLQWWCWRQRVMLNYLSQQDHRHSSGTTHICTDGKITVTALVVWQVIFLHPEKQLNSGRNVSVAILPLNEINQPDEKKRWGWTHTVLWEYESTRSQLLVSKHLVWKTSKPPLGWQQQIPRVGKHLWTFSSLWGWGFRNTWPLSYKKTISWSAEQQPQGTLNGVLLFLSILLRCVS